MTRYPIKWIFACIHTAVSRYEYNNPKWPTLDTALVKVMAWHRIDDKPLSVSCWPRSLTHICDTEYNALPALHSQFSPTYSKQTPTPYRDIRKNNFLVSCTKQHARLAIYNVVPSWYKTIMKAPQIELTKDAHCISLTGSYSTIIAITFDKIDSQASRGLLAVLH